MTRRTHRAACLLGLLLLPAVVQGQDSNILQSVAEIEQLLGSGDFEIVSMAGARMPGDRTFATTLRFSEGTMMRVQWAPAPKGGGEFNNEPRYELGAYEIQKLFLDESEFVVPPTAGRCIPFSEYGQHENRMPIPPTFDNWNMVLVVLQYWLWNVEGGDVYDKDRFRDDPAYARHLANFNILTYLIRHNDSNEGNYVISMDPANPRVFAVDNGVAFASEESDRGHEFRDIRVDRLPRSTIDRLRGLTLEDFQRALGVVAQFEVDAGRLMAADPSENLNPERGIRREGMVLQLGLTRREIESVYRRVERLLDRVDSGRYELF